MRRFQNLRPRTRVLFLLLTALILGCVWYARPVDIYQLSPGLDVTNLSAVIDRFGPDGLPELREVQLKPGQPAFDAVMEQAEALRVRRSPLNGVRRLLPKTTTGRETAQGDWNFVLYLHGAHIQGLHLQFFIDRWSYADSGRYLPLSVAKQDPAAAGQALSELLWTLGVPVETDQAAETDAEADAEADAAADAPSDTPAGAPANARANAPAGVPSGVPAGVSAGVPAGAPSDVPADAPSSVPSDAPAGVPTGVPSGAPSDAKS